MSRQKREQLEFRRRPQPSHTRTGIWGQGMSRMDAQAEARLRATGHAGSLDTGNVASRLEASCEQWSGNKRSIPGSVGALEEIQDAEVESELGECSQAHQGASTGTHDSPSATQVPSAYATRGHQAPPGVVESW